MRFDPARHVSKCRFDAALTRNGRLLHQVVTLRKREASDTIRIVVLQWLLGASWAIFITYLALGK
jgi:hypothetical protein